MRPSICAEWLAFSFYVSIDIVAMWYLQPDGSHKIMQPWSKHKRSENPLSKYRDNVLHLDKQMVTNRPSI